MIDLFRDKSASQGLAAIDSLYQSFLGEHADQTENTAPADPVPGVLKLIYLLLYSGIDKAHPDYTHYLRSWFSTEQNSGLFGKSRLAAAIKDRLPMILAAADKEALSEEDKAALESAFDSLYDGTWTEDAFDRGTEFLKWDAKRQPDPSDRRKFLAQIRFGLDEVAANCGERDPDEPPLNLLRIFKYRQKQMDYMAQAFTNKLYSLGDRENIRLYESLRMSGAFGRHEAYSLFVLRRYLEFYRPAEVSDNHAEADVLIWFMEAVHSVLDDPLIQSENRRFFDILLKLREDLAYDPNHYEALAETLTDWLLSELPFAFFHWWEDEDAPEEWADRDYIASMEFLRVLKQSLYKAPSAEPSRLHAYLDRYVIGQEDAKKTLSTAVYGHLKRIRYRREHFIPDAVMLVGPSGCGKTELVRRLAEATELPFVIVDVSGMNGSQYTGGLHREDLLIDLMNRANGDQEKAENGILFMDEFDKLLIPSIASNGTDTHEEVQNQLLTVIEGGEIEISWHDERIMFDTSRLLFIMAGAFQGIEENIRATSLRALRSSGTIGFDASLKKEMDTGLHPGSVTIDVLMSYGMKRELAGRIGSIAVLEPLKREDLRRILNEPKDCILRSFQSELHALCGMKLVLDDPVTEKILDMAEEYRVGARGLGIALRKLLLPVFYEAPEHRGAREVFVRIEDGRQIADWRDGLGPDDPDEAF
ncbi:MAG: AAA family ATPase [Lachnospiraceae bacterium]|nr:AAA family ATPase [Lachnospiraceae bacterium]